MVQDLSYAVTTPSLHLLAQSCPARRGPVRWMQEAQDTGGDTVVDCGLGPTYGTEHVAWPGKERKKDCCFVCWLLNVPATCYKCISGTDLHNFTCCHTEIEAADPAFYFTQSQYTDTGPTSPSADPIMQGAWQSSHWSTNFSVTGMTRPGKIPSQAGFEPRIFRSLKH